VGDDAQQPLAGSRSSSKCSSARNDIVTLKDDVLRVVDGIDVSWLHGIVCVNASVLPSRSST
jgi:hypothetical protein